MKKTITIIVGITLLCLLFFTLIQSFKGAETTDSQEEVQNTEITPTNIEEKSSDIYINYPDYDNPDLVFFWGDGCPHCQNVEDWISQNNATDKIKINFREVYDSDSGRAELFDTVKQYCPELMTSDGGIGVPTAFNPVTEECIQGDTPIIELLSTKTSD